MAVDRRALNRHSTGAAENLRGAVVLPLLRTLLLSHLGPRMLDVQGSECTSA